MFSKMTSDRKVCPKIKPTVKVAMTGREFIAAQMELRQMERDREQLKQKAHERKQYLIDLHRRNEELKQIAKEAREQRFKLEMFFRDEETESDRLMAEKEMKEALEKEAEIRRLTEECEELKKRKQEMQLQTLKYTPYREFLERVLKLTKFTNVDELAGYLENLLYIRDQLYQRETQVQEHMEQQKKACQSLKDNHNLLLLQKNNHLSQLQTELEKARSEALIWERQWNQIQETAAKKTLELGQITYATLNLFEMAGGVTGVGGLHIHDTEKQLEAIKNFMMDHTDIVKHYQTHMHREARGSKSENKGNIK